MFCKKKKNQCTLIQKKLKMATHSKQKLEELEKHQEESEFVEKLVIENKLGDLYI